MAKLETVERIREAIEAARLTTKRENPQPGRLPWDVVSVSQDGSNPDVRVHSSHAIESEAYTAWQLLERRKIVRAVVETLREPDMGMLMAGLDRLGGAANAPLSGRALEDAWTAMVDALLSELPGI